MKKASITYLLHVFPSRFFFTLPALILLLIAVFPGLSMAVSELETARSTILSASEVDYPPFCFVDSDGQATGFSVELLRASAAAMGQDVTFRIGPWSDVKGWLEKGTVQVLPLVGRTPERESIFDFTFAYMSLHGAIVVREGTDSVWDLTDLAGKRVAVMKGDNAEEFLRRKERNFEIVTTVTYEDALRELQNGNYDAVVVQQLVALRLIQQLGLSNLEVVKKTIEGFRQDFCFAVREADRDTLALLNEGLSIVMADGTYRHLHAKWFAVLELPTDRRLVVGGDNNYPPYEFLDDKGRPTGFNVDITRAIARVLGLDLEIRLGPWAKIRQELERGDIDVIQGMFYSPERDKVFDFSPSYIVNTYIAVVRTGSMPPPKTIQDMMGREIAVQRGDIMHDFALNNGLQAHLHLAESQEAALSELVAGQNDCALVSRRTALFLIKKHGWTNLTVGKHSLLSPDYCYAFQKNRQALQSQFSEGLKVLEENGDYRRIYEQRMGIYDDSPPLSTIIRASAYIVIPLLLLVLVFFLWSWFLRKKVAEKTEELVQSFEIQRALITCSPVALYSCDLRGNVQSWNTSAERIFGWMSDETIDGPLPCVPDEAQAEIIDLRKKVLDGHEILSLEVVRLRKSGDRFDASLSMAPIFDSQGQIIGIMSAILDITHRKQSEKLLRESEQHFRNLADSGMALIWTSGIDAQFDYFNQPWLNFTGRTMNQERGIGWMEGIHHDDFQDVRALYAESCENREPFSMIFRLRSNDGDYRWMQTDASPRYDSSGQFLGFIGQCLDVTEFKRAQERIEHLKNVLKAIRDVNQLIVRVRDRETLIHEGCRLLVDNRGYASALIILTDNNDKPISWVGEGLKDAFGPLNDLLESGTLPPCCRVGQPTENVVLINDRSRVCEACPITADCGTMDALSVRLTHDGESFGYLAVAVQRGLGSDPEEQSLFAEMASDLAYALRSLRNEESRQSSEQERDSLQNQLLQAQKMDAIGRLAGGVAHDFNNMIGVIIGYAEIALDRLRPEDPLVPDLTEILKAAGRSADITRQLLAFARKQTINPKVLDLNETVKGMLKMLRRLIGEDIDLAWLPASGLWSVKMDPVQLDQIMVNLCINARDAINGVGKVTIETRDVTFDKAYCDDHIGFTEGDFVLLAISDDGGGMDKATLAKIFEPFYTTKDSHKGTGLGLATVFGIVTQNGGFINVYSEVDKGSTFNIYIPRCESPSTDSDRKLVQELPMSKGETILLVEDEPSIIKLGTLMLEKLGYRVLAASSPGVAIGMCRENRDTIHLLMTDVVMPDMNGRDLARQLISEYPALKTLFMSGYTANVIVHRGILDEDVCFIQKPFSLKDLACKVREAIDGQ